MNPPGRFTSIHAVATAAAAAQSGGGVEMLNHPVVLGSGGGGAFLPPKPHFVVAPSMHASVSASANVMTVPASLYASNPGISPQAAAAAAAAAAASPNIIAPQASLYPGW